MNIGVLVGLLLLSIPITVIITLLDEYSIALRIILVYSVHSHVHDSVYHVFG